MDIIIGIVIIAAFVGVFLFLASMGRRSRGDVISHIPDPPPRKKRTGGNGSGDQLP